MAFEQGEQIVRAGKAQQEESALARHHLHFQPALQQQPAARPGGATGADLRQGLVRADRPFDQHLDAPAAVLDPVQARMQHARVVEDQQITPAQQHGQLGKAPVFQVLAIDRQQAAGRALGQRELGDQFRRQRVIEIGEGKRHFV